MCCPYTLQCLHSEIHICRADAYSLLHHSVDCTAREHETAYAANERDPDVSACEPTAREREADYTAKARDFSAEERVDISGAKKR